MIFRSHLGSRKASIFVAPLCRLLEESCPEHRRKIWLCGFTLKQRKKKSTASELFYAKETLTCGSLLSTRSPRQFWVLLSKSSALSTTTERRVAEGVSRMKCYMTIEKTRGVYTNYTVESMEPAGYFY